MENRNKTTKIENVSMFAYKNEGTANPISSNIFCADPTAVEYNGRLYLYGTNDHQQYDAVGNDGKNTYEQIKSLVIYSTDDMVNWTYHGLIDLATVAPWIYNSWAPSIASRVEADGLTHFYLYFSNSGCGVGVITATNPTGPWSDPLGKPLIYKGMDGLVNSPEPFDPGVCIDDNGIGWLTFGGGRGEQSTEYMPDVCKIVQLGEDMISLASDFATIHAPYFYEASELNFINDTYVYTFNTSWVDRYQWDYEGYDTPTRCSMAYMTSKTPLDTDSWEYRGHYFLNSGDSGMDDCNNHTHLEKYKGVNYLFHHTMLLQEDMPTKGGFRSLCVEELIMDESTLTIPLQKATRGGVSQIKTLNPFDKVSGCTMFTSAEMWHESSGKVGEMAAQSLNSGSWIYIKGADFAQSARSLIARVKGEGTIEFRLDDVNSDAVASFDFSTSDWQDLNTDFTEKISGEHDVYIVFSAKDIYLESWNVK